MRKTRALVPRTPFGGSVLDEFDRLFDEFPRGMWGPFFRPGPVGGWGAHALTDLKDEGDAFVLEMDLPGVSKEDINIEVDESGAEVRTSATEETEESGEGYLLRERHQGTWVRRIPFPSDVVPEKVDASLEDGVLTVRFPKAKPPEPKATRTVAVK